MKEIVNYDEWRPIPIIGLDAVYQINRRGQVEVKRTRGFQRLTPKSTFEYQLRVDGAQRTYNVNLLLDRAFPEDAPGHRVLQHRKTGLWHLYDFRQGAMHGQLRAWRIVSVSTYDDLPLSAAKLASEQKGKVISGEEWLNRKQEEAAESATKELEDLMTGGMSVVADSFTGRGRPEVPFEIPKAEEFTPEPTGEPDLRELDPLLALANAAASLTRSIELLIKNRSEQ